MKKIILMILGIIALATMFSVSITELIYNPNFFWGVAFGIDFVCLYIFYKNLIKKK